MPSSRRESFCLFVGLARTFKCAANLLDPPCQTRIVQRQWLVRGRASAVVWSGSDQQCCQRFAESNFLGRRYEPADLGPSMRMSCITGRSAETTGVRRPSPQSVRRGTPRAVTVAPRGQQRSGSDASEPDRERTDRSTCSWLLIPIPTVGAVRPGHHHHQQARDAGKHPRPYRKRLSTLEPAGRGPFAGSQHGHAR